MSPFQLALTHSFAARHMCIMTGLPDAVVHFPDPSFETKKHLLSAAEHWLLMAQSWVLPQKLSSADGSCLSQGYILFLGAAPIQFLSLWGHRGWSTYPNSGHPEADPSSRHPRGISWELCCDRLAAQPLPLCAFVALIPQRSLSWGPFPANFCMQISLSKSVVQRNWPKTIGETTFPKLKCID